MCSSDLADMSSFSASMSRIQPAMRARASVNFRQKLSPAVGVVRTLAGRDTRPFPTKYQRENTRSSVIELAQVAVEFDSETVTTFVAALLGVGAGIGVPIFFVMQEERDKERLEEIRELNRATLKATGEQMSEEEISELRPSRYLDRREFKDDD